MASQSKEEFFDELHAEETDESSLTSVDEADIITDEESGPLKSRSVIKSRERRMKKDAAEGTGKTERPASPAQLGQDKTVRASARNPVKSKASSDLSSTASKTSTAPDSHDTEAANMPPKKKQLPEADTTPGVKLIFEGCVFFYYPHLYPDEPEVKTAIECGAAWTPNVMDDSITHIIFSTTAIRKNFWEILNRYPIAHLFDKVEIVNQTYIDECVKAETLLDPRKFNSRLDPKYIPGLEEAREDPGLVRSEQERILKEADEEAMRTAKALTAHLPEPEELTYNSDPGSEPDPDLEDWSHIPIQTNYQPLAALLGPSKPNPASATSSSKPNPASATGSSKPSDQKADNDAGSKSTLQLVPKVKVQLNLSGPGDAQGPSHALDEAIEEAKQTKDLPLDDEPGPGDVEETSEEDNESEDERNFACMQKHDGLQLKDNPNARTIEILQQMADYYERAHDQWRTIGYRKAITTLKHQTTKVMFQDEAKALPFIGDRLAAKIEEIVRTNGLRRLSHTTLDPADRALELFLGIYGVGFRQAHVWLGQGLRTLDDVRRKAALTDNQKVGLEHHADFAARIPRSEVGQHWHVVESLFRGVSKALRVEVGGSYRRGAPDGGDVDLLVTADGMSFDALRRLFLDEAIPKLYLAMYLKATLAAPKKDSGSKFHGAAVLPGLKPPKGALPKPWRRVDFLLVPESEWGAALLYFTGNDVFNRSIRLLAGKKGMRLNQHGLWKDVVRGPKRERVTQGTLVESKSEERIFELLGVPYRPPQHRVC